MEYDVLILGLGNIGLSLANFLIRDGYKVAGIDISNDKLENLRNMGGKAIKADILETEEISRYIKHSKVLASALPGGFAYKVLHKLSYIPNIKLVDVSFFPESIDPLRDRVSSNNSIFILDCGIAPGLSNMILKYAVEKVRGRKAFIYVGGISEYPVEPLGYVATWNISDFIDEYLRPARAIINGELKALDPLTDKLGKKRYEGLGELEYFPSDGLRSMLKSFEELDELIEYTLRWPGHIEKMRFLKQIGLLNSKPLTGCGGCSPRRVLELMLQETLPKVNDIVVLEVEVYGDEYFQCCTVVKSRDGMTAMALSTAGFQYTVVKSLLENILETKPGIYYPEDIPTNLFDWFMEELTKIGIKLNGM